MRPRRSTRTAGGSSGVCADSVSDNGDSPCQAGALDESIVMDTKMLLEMLGPSSPAAGEAEQDDEEEDGEEEDETRDLVMDLDGRFKNADIKRKFSESMPVMSEVGTLHDDTGDSLGSDSGDGGAKSRDSSTSTSSSSSSVVVASLPEAGVAAAPVPRQIKTVLRVRPLEPSAGPLSLRVMDSKTVRTNNPRTGAKVFKYGRVLDETTPQESVFKETAEPLVEGLLHGPGKNGLVMAYGATNAGKTHTIMGAGGEDDGILPRTLAALYEGIMRGGTGGAPDDASPGGGEGAGRDHLMRLNFRVVEVYLNKAYDLLRKEEERGEPISFKQSQGEDTVNGLSAHYPEDLPAALDLVRQARSRAPVSATALNKFSSRGHTVWMLEVQRGDGRVAVAAADGRAAVGGRGSGFDAAQRPATRNPMLSIVDLAGSERIDRSMSNGREAIDINSDITEMFRCFKHVEAGHQHVPYRNRTLTRMLKNVLVRGPNSADPLMSCVMVVNVNPAASEYSETQKVLNNALISMKARIVEEPPRAGCGSEPTAYGMNGHLISKRRKVSGGGAAGGGAGAADGTALRLGSVSGKGEESQLALADRSRRRGAGGAQRPTLSRAEQANVIDEQGENIVRLEDEVARLQKVMKEMEETVWHQAQAEIVTQIDELEEALTESLARENGLRLQLDRKEPVGANARAAVVQSARKQAARKAETVHCQMSQNIQEAEDETVREAEKRAVAEEALAVALADRDAEAARAAEALDAQAASEAAVRQELARSEGKAEQLEAEVVAERSRAAELDAKNDNLAEELRAALEEIARLQDAVALAEAEAEAEVGTVKMELSSSSTSVCLCTDYEKLQRFHSDGESDPLFDSPTQRRRAPIGRGKGKRVASMSSGSGCGRGDGSRCGNSSSSGSGSEGCGAVSAAGSPKASEDEDGEGGEAGDADGQRELCGLKSSPLRLRQRKPLGHLEQASVNAGGIKAVEGGGKAHKEKNKVGREEEAEEEEEEEEEEEDKGTKAARSRAETRRCKSEREAAMLSKPSPKVVVLTALQAATRGKLDNLVKSRRSNRRRGQR